MVIVAAAQQSRFFEEISRNLTFWGGLAEVCALIGFTALVIGYLLRRVGILHILTWVLVMILLFVAPLNAISDGTRNSDTLFFTALTPTQYDWTRQPYRTQHQPTGQENKNPEPRTPLDDIREIEQVKKGRPLYLLSPQLALIDAFNHIRGAVGGSFVSGEGGYTAPVTDFARQNSSTLEPLANFSRLLFGNISEGTWSALLPMLLTFIMVIVIVCTPFILMLAVMVPHWGPGLLLLSVGGVVYAKMVEVMFAMVHGILGLFLDLGPAGAMGGASAVNEVLLGLGYLLALAASVWLVYKVRHTGKGVHGLLQDFIRESRAAGQQVQQKTAENLAKGITSRSFQSVSLPPAGGQQALMAPLQRLPMDGSSAGASGGAASQNSLYNKAAFQQTAQRQETDKQAASSAATQGEALAQAFRKVREDAFRKAQQEGVPQQASLPQAATAGSGQKGGTSEPALSRVARAFGGKTPEELSRSYRTATHLFSSGVLSMRTDDDNNLQVEVNLSLEVMQSLSPELQSAVNQLQRDGFIARTIAAGSPCFVLKEPGDGES